MELTEEGGYKVEYEGRELIIKEKNRWKKRKEKKTILADASYDVTLKVGNEELHAHKGILSKNIYYFQGMFSETANFKEKTQRVIDLGPDIHFKSLAKITHLLYAGDMTVDISEVQDLFHLADLWNIATLAHCCAKLITLNMEPTNCLDVLELANRLGSYPTLVHQSEQLIRERFSAVVTTDSFLGLNKPDLINILCLENLRLGPQEEDFLFEAVMKWLRCDTEQRLVDLEDIFPYIPLSAVSQKCLLKYTSSEFKIKEAVKHCLESGVMKCLKRECQQYFLVLSGLTQPRQNPLSPPAIPMEKFDPQFNTFSVLKEPSSTPSQAVVFNLHGLILYVMNIHVFEDSVKKDSKSALFVYNPVCDKWSNGGKELFSDEAWEVLIETLANEGVIVHCSFSDRIFLVRIQKSLCLDVKCINGDVSVKLGENLPSLKAFLPEDHSNLNGVMHKGQLFVMGGMQGPSLERKFSPLVFALSRDCSQWMQVASMLVPRIGFTVVSLGNSIYVIGGYSNVYLGRRFPMCEQYSVEEDKWYKFDSMHQMRAQHCSFVINNKIYTLGGKSYSSQKYTSGDDASIPYPRGARIVTDQLEVINLNTYEGFTEDKTSWVQVARMKWPRRYFHFIVI